MPWRPLSFYLADGYDTVSEAIAAPAIHADLAQDFGMCLRQPAYARRIRQGYRLGLMENNDQGSIMR